MTVKLDVTLEEALDSIKILQDAAAKTDYDLKILEVGGYKPLAYATHIISEHSYDSDEVKGFYPDNEDTVITLSPSNWSIHKLDAEKWPFADKEFDVCWCADVLDRMTNPVFMLEEMSRIARIGYVRVSDRNYESLLNVESPDYPGYKDNKWLIDYNHVLERLLFLSKESYAETSNHHPTIPGKKYITIMWRGELLGLEDILPAKKV